MPFIPDAPTSRFVPDEPAPKKNEKDLSGRSLSDIREKLLGKPMGQVIEEAPYDIGGKVTDVTGSPGLGYAANVVAQSVPMLIGGQGAKAAAPALEAGAKSLMHSALKPSIRALKNGDAAKAISTMLDEGINATKGGVEKLRGKISELNDQIVQAIKEYERRNGAGWRS